MTLRVRIKGSQGEHNTYSTVSPSRPLAPAKPLLPNSKPERLHHVDLGQQLPPDCPIAVQRWLELPDATADGRSEGSRPLVPGEVHLWFSVSNPGNDELEVGSLGLSMPMVRGIRWRCEFRIPVT